MQVLAFMANDSLEHSGMDQSTVEEERERLSLPFLS